MPGTLLMRDPAEADALITAIVMDKGSAQQLDGAMEAQGQERMLTTDMMRAWLEANALQTHHIVIGLTETTTVTDTEPAPHKDGAKESQDDLNPQQILTNNYHWPLYLKEELIEYIKFWQIFLGIRLFLLLRIKSQSQFITSHLYRYKNYAS